MKRLALSLALTLIISGCAGIGEESPTKKGEGKNSTPVTSSIKPESEVDGSLCNIEENFGKCLFDQTAVYEDSRRNGDEVKLEITVKNPRRFTPSTNADFAIKTLGGTPGRGPDNLYFEITIKNTSQVAVLAHNDVELSANSATDGNGDVRTVQDDNVRQFWEATLKPGQSSTMKSGWNFNNSASPTFEVSVDGLGGNSVTFSQK
ncbi:hypothetical protein ACQR35_12880 [Pseudarthrobacter sp. J1738]|uniref:hypothetical protein n=1 Tax=Pseudarthrobacter sp. J1738 TaxID=3420446 RepID=UPI003D26AFF1